MKSLIDNAHAVIHVHYFKKTSLVFEIINLNANSLLETRFLFDMNEGPSDCKVTLHCRFRILLQYQELVDKW